MRKNCESLQTTEVSFVFSYVNLCIPKSRGGLIIIIMVCPTASASGRGFKARRATPGFSKFKFGIYHELNDQNKTP